MNDSLNPCRIAQQQLDDAAQKLGLEPAMHKLSLLLFFRIIRIRYLKRISLFRHPTESLKWPQTWPLTNQLFTSFMFRHPPRVDSCRFTRTIRNKRESDFLLHLNEYGIRYHPFDNLLIVNICSFRMKI